MVVQRHDLPAVARRDIEDATVRAAPDGHLPRPGGIGWHAHANRVVAAVRTRTAARRRRRAVQTLVGRPVAVVVQRVAGLVHRSHVVARSPSAVRVAGLLTRDARAEVRAAHPHLPGVAVPRARVLLVHDAVAVVVHAVPAHFAGVRVDELVAVVAVGLDVLRHSARHHVVVTVAVLVAGACPRFANVDPVERELHAGEPLPFGALARLVAARAIFVARVHGARVPVVALPITPEHEIRGAFVAPLGRDVRPLPELLGPDEAKFPAGALRVVGHPPAPVSRVAGIHRAPEPVVADDEVVCAPTLHVADVGRTRVPIVALLGLPALRWRGAPRRIVVRVRDARACIARVRDPVPVHVTVALVASAVLVQIRLVQVDHCLAVVPAVADAVAVLVGETALHLLVADEPAPAHAVEAQAPEGADLALHLGLGRLTLTFHRTFAFAFHRTFAFALTLAGLGLWRLAGLALRTGLAAFALRPLRTHRPLGTGLALLPALALRAVPTVAVADIEGAVVVRVLGDVVLAVHVEVPAAVAAGAGRTRLALRTRLARVTLEPLAPGKTRCGRHRGQQEHALHAHLLCLVSHEDLVLGPRWPVENQFPICKVLGTSRFRLHAVAWPMLGSSTR